MIGSEIRSDTNGSFHQDNFHEDMRVRRICPQPLRSCPLTFVVVGYEVKVADRACPERSRRKCPPHTSLSRTTFTPEARRAGGRRAGGRGGGRRIVRRRGRR